MKIKRFVTSNAVRMKIIAAVLGLFTIFIACGHSADYIGRKGEKRREIRSRYRESERKEGQPLKWEVVFRGVGKGYTPSEKKAGFSKRNSLKIYVQYSEGNLIPIDIQELDDRAKEAGKDIFPIYLPEDIGAFVLERNSKNLQMLKQLKNGDRITISGTIKESRFRSGSRKLTGFVNIAKVIKEGWNIGEQNADLSKREESSKNKK